MNNFPSLAPTLASLIPVSDICGLSSTRKAARLAVYEATMIIAKPAHTIPSTRALKLRGVPGNQCTGCKIKKKKFNKSKNTAIKCTSAKNGKDYLTRIALICGVSRGTH